jgi:predicted nuclease of predicted toxin-antitoxin system
VKVLLDSCVWGKAADELRAAGHDAEWAGSWPEDPGDEVILARAHAEARILITLDKDFGELAILRRHPHHGIVRLVNFAARQQAAACLAVLAAHADELLAGAIVTAEASRMRIRTSQPHAKGGE